MTSPNASVKAARELTTVETVALNDLFSGQLPVTVKSLTYNLNQLDSDINNPLLDTVEIIYAALTRELNSRQRKLFFSYIVQEVENQRTNASALLVFCRFEPDQHIVCQAVWSYLLNRKTTFEAPMLAVEELLSLLSDYSVNNRGALYAGLVCFGDRRVCAAARMIRHTISAEDAKGFSSAVTAPLHRATLDFCLYWLMDLLMEKDFEMAMHVAYALSSMVIKDDVMVVHDREHHFGPFAFRASQALPEVSWQSWLQEYAPVLKTLGLIEKPAIEQMLAIFEDPQATTLEQLERRKNASRRNDAERRASDRRIVNITPILERRSRNRREGERRTLDRRG